MEILTKAKVTVVSIFILTLGAAIYVAPQLWNNTFGSITTISEEDSSFRLGLDLQGGTHLVYQADVSELDPAEQGESLEGVRDVIERRVNVFGVSEPVVQVNRAGDEYRLIVELAGIKDPNAAIEAIGQTPLLDFREVSNNPNATSTSDLYIRTGLDGSMLDKATVVFQQGSSALQSPQVSLDFNKQGSELFKELTTKNLGRPIAIFLDGALVSAPTVQSVIDNGQAVITGQYTLDEAKDLARNLNAGALPVPIELVSQQTVGATLGLESLNASVKAAAFGILLLTVFMLVVYRFAGVVAMLSLTVYGILILAAFKFIGVTLTLSGIAGFTLSLGMAVDANVLIFERIREELANGVAFEQAVQAGFQRAWTAIRDGNLTTFFIALILYWIGFGFVQGFALTLAIGVVVSVFSAVFVSKRLLMLTPRFIEDNSKLLLPRKKYADSTTHDS